MKAVIRIHILLVVLAMLPANVLAQQGNTAGQFHFVNGAVAVIGADGGQRPATKGGDIHEGDTIDTDHGGSAQLRMKDGGLLAVRPGTRLKIEQYQYNDDDGNDRSFFGLLKGSFRSITGWIGKRNKRAYRVSTPTSTIGIRGSDADIGYEPVKQLTGVRTYTGEHTITGKDEDGNPQTISTKPGQIAVHTPGSAPELTDVFPFEAPAPNQLGSHQRDPLKNEPLDELLLPEDEQSVLEGEEDTGEIAQLSEGALDPIYPKFIAGATVPVGGGGVTPPTKHIAAVAGSMYFSGGPLAGNGGFVTGIDPNDFVTIDQLGLLTGGRDYDSAIPGARIAFDAVNATHVTGGSADITTTDGSFVVSTAHWGVWQGGYILVINAAPVPSTTGFNYAYAENGIGASELMALPPGSFTYSFIGGTATNEAGEIGNNLNITASGNFSGTSTLGDITINVGSFAQKVTFASGSTNWYGTFGGPIPNLLSGGIPKITGDCFSGGGPCSPDIGDATGEFVGLNADGLLVGFSMTDTVNNKAFTGTGALQRQ